MYDLVIIGGGPAGTAAGVYAARKKVRSVLITEEWGGQSAVSSDVQNWIGTVSLMGNEIAKNLKEPSYRTKIKRAKILADLGKKKYEALNQVFKNVSLPYFC